MTTLAVRAPWPAAHGWAGAWIGPDAAGSDAPLMHWAQAEDLPACSELLLVVPAPLLSWHRVELPRLPASRWNQALRGLLEDRLLSDAEATHLALAPGSAAGQAVQVAACDKAWLSQTLQALARAGRNPSRIVPEYEPDGSGLHLLGSPEQGRLVHCGAGDVLCLPLSHPAQGTLQAWHALHPRVPVQAEPGLASQAQSLWGQAAELSTPAQALQRATRSRWDLAQFDVSLRRTPAQRLARLLQQAWQAPAWRAARLGLVLLLALHALGLLGWAWHAERAQQALRQDMHRIYTAAFPQARLVIDPLRQMERETQALAQAKGQAARHDLASLLAALADLPGGLPARLEYAAGELRLPAWTPEPASLPALQATLARSGLRLAPAEGGWSLRAQAPEGTP